VWYIGLMFLRVKQETVLAGGCGGVQAEKELSEVNLQLESLHERLEEADGLSSAQVAIATHSPRPLLSLQLESRCCCQWSLIF